MSEFSRRGLVRAGAGALLGGGMSGACASAPEASASAQKVWVFDRLEGIGGVTTHVEGEPVLIDSPFGRAPRPSRLRFCSVLTAGRLSSVGFICSN
jgi:hypothetical protein